MTDSAETLRARMVWVKHYEQSQDAGLTCRRCGVSRPTLRKWSQVCDHSGKDTKQMGKQVWHPRAVVASAKRSFACNPSRAKSKTSRHRSHIPVTEAVLDLRRKRKLGPKGIQSELKRLHETQFSTATIWRILARHGISQSVRPRRKPKVPKRYNRPVPGDRVQIDNCKIGKNLHQFTAQVFA